MSTPSASSPVTWIVLSSLVHPSSPRALPKSSETVAPEDAAVAAIVWPSPPVVLDHPSCCTSQTWWLTPGAAVIDRAPPLAVVPAALPSSVKSQPARPGSPSFCVPLWLRPRAFLLLLAMSLGFPNGGYVGAPH